jgi:hypothetical protein
LSFLFDVVVTRLFLPVFAKFSWTFFHSYIFLLLLSLKKKVYTFHPPPYLHISPYVYLYSYH